MSKLQIRIDRAAREPVSEQIAAGLRAAIREGRLAPRARLPSWRDLASQLGVARGTVSAAYERLLDAQLIVSLGAAGTFVAEHLPPSSRPCEAGAVPSAPVGSIPSFPGRSGIFQMANPAQDLFPAKVWARIMTGAVRATSHARQINPDPRGELALRSEIAAYLSLARGLPCTAAQVFVTTGYAGSLSLAVQALGLRGTSAWTEDPGYPTTRRCLHALGVEAVPVPVDAEGLVVDEGVARAPDAALAVVTAGQQAPLGVALSARRRQAILAWAERARAWVVEDDYLGELQLGARAAPSLVAAGDGARVLHVGTFSKTISPMLRLGFLVVPAAEVERFARHAAVVPPAPLVQLAVAAFLRDGHFLRHLRRTRQVYAQRRAALVACLDAASATYIAAGLTVLLRLAPGVSDLTLAQSLAAHGLTPVPLSPWFAQPGPENTGLLLGVADLRVEIAAETCARLLALVRQG
jgi:GntR family transcriptional regulator/MocR family aminotransferase